MFKDNISTVIVSSVLHFMLVVNVEWDRLLTLYQLCVSLFTVFSVRAFCNAWYFRTFNLL